MPSRPRRPATRAPVSRSPDDAFWSPSRAPGAAAPSPPESPDAPSFTVSARSAAEAAHGALQDALRDLGELDDEPAAEFGNVPSDLLGRHGVAGRRVAWAAGDGARDRVYAAAGVYARALRREGVGLPAALVAVRATVVAAVALDGVDLPPGPLDALQRAAARCCLEAFYAH